MIQFKIADNSLLFRNGENSQRNFVITDIEQWEDLESLKKAIFQYEEDIRLNTYSAPVVYSDGIPITNLRKWIEKLRTYDPNKGSIRDHFYGGGGKTNL